jgi:predicted transcriptional regulator
MVKYGSITMAKSTITVRVENRKRQALDTLAHAMDRDRSYILNQAIETYLDLHTWQIAHIREGLRQAQSGRFASDSEVKKAWARWRR